MALGRWELPPRLTDWTLFATVLVALATGLVSLVSGRPGDWVVFAAHGVAGLALPLLLAWKLRRVRHRLGAAVENRTVALSVVLALVTAGAVATGLFWALGGDLDLGYWNALNLHVLLGLLVVPLLLWHLRRRVRLPTADEARDRRRALQYGGLLAFGALTWRLRRWATAALGVVDARFTGSRERGTDPDEGFPVTSWVADDPDPVDVEDWTLAVEGAVSRPLELDIGAVAGGDRSERRAVLDCTSGWYTVQDWRGVRVGDLLAAAALDEAARWVSFESVTGYRWSLPLDEAREALLATHVGGERLSHGHGAPLRLVAPGRRGFQWVKWVERVEVRRTRDFGQWVAVFVSGFD